MCAEQLNTSTEVVAQGASNAGSIISNIAEWAVNNYERNLSTREESAYKQFKTMINDKFAEQIANEINGIEIGDLEFRAREMSHNQPNSEEGKAGADLMIAFGANFKDYQTATSVLIQFKTKKKGGGYKTSNLSDGVENMLNETSDSFIGVFPFEGNITFISAYNIAGICAADVDIPDSYPHDFQYMSVGNFFELFVQGYIGDYLTVGHSLHPLTWTHESQIIE